MISVITVTYNCAATIEETIQSVLKQRNTGFEYIIVDGKSTDGTTEIIESYKDSLAFFLSEPDDGIYHAMNKAIDIAKGDYLYFLNGDDLLCDKEVLSSMNDYLSEDTITIGQVYYGSRLSQKPLGNMKSPYYGFFYPHQGMFIPKKIFEAIGKYDTSYRISADFEWICRALFKKIHISWVDLPVAFYRIGGRSESLQCVIDEYNISKKYLELSNANNLISDMKLLTIDNLKNAILKIMLKNQKFDSYIERTFSAFWPEEKRISLWGAGHLSTLFVQSLKRIGYSVECIIDKNPKTNELHGIPVCKYERNKIHNILIATEAFDQEITGTLLNEGFVSHRDFLSHRDFKNQLVSLLSVDNEIINVIYQECDIQLLDYIN